MQKQQLFLKVIQWLKNIMRSLLNKSSGGVSEVPSYIIQHQSYCAKYGKIAFPSIPFSHTFPHTHLSHSNTYIKNHIKQTLKQMVTLCISAFSSLPSPRVKKQNTLTDNRVCVK